MDEIDKTQRRSGGILGWKDAVNENAARDSNFHGAFQASLARYTWWKLMGKYRLKRH